MQKQYGGVPKKFKVELSHDAVPYLSVHIQSKLKWHLRKYTNIRTYWMLFSPKKEGNHATCDNIDKPRGHHTEWQNTQHR